MQPRKILLVSLFVFVLLFYTVIASAWSSCGHRTIGQIAEDHLSPEAKACFIKYFGQPLASMALDADDFRAYWTLDLGFKPTNPDDARLKWLTDFDFTTPINISPWSHSITVDSDFVSYPSHNHKGKYINNDAYYVDSLSRVLCERFATMDPDERYMDVALIIHFLGDMHCPMHIVYLPGDMRKGAYDVIYKNKSSNFHNLWDSTFIGEISSDYRVVVPLVDTATDEQILKITSGTPFDWAGDCGKACWPVHIEYNEGDTLPDTYVNEHKELMFSQLRNGGYRLAKVLNDIFKNVVID